MQSPARGKPAAHATFAGITLSGGAQQLAFTGTPLLYGGVTVSSNGFVAPAAGLYRVKSNIQLDYAAGSNFWVEGFIYQNGVTVADFLQVEGTFVNGFPGFEFSKLVSAAAGDVFKFYAESSSAPNVNSDDKGSYAEIELVSQA